MPRPDDGTEVQGILWIVFTIIYAALAIFVLTQAA